jgi:hypothetical protein
VLISGAVAAEATAPLVPLGEHMLRGIAAPCAVFTPCRMRERRKYHGVEPGLLSIVQRIVELPSHFWCSRS